MIGEDSFKEQINSIILLYSDGNVSEALNLLKVLIKKNPNEPILFNISGVCYKEIAKFNEAIESFERAIELKPDYIEAIYNLGLTFQELGNTNNAIKFYHKAITLKPDYAEAHNNLGVIYKDLGEIDNAIKNYKKAIHYRDDYSEAHNNLGNALKESGQLNASVDCYQRALEIEPLSSEINYNLGNIFKDLGKKNDAIKFYQKALIIQPDNIDAYNNIGISFLELGQLNDAIKSYEKALVMMPDKAELYNNIGITYYKLGQLNIATKFYNKALKLQPNYADAYANNGTALKDLNRLNEALSNYESAITENPNLDFILGDVLHTKMHLCIWDNFLDNLNKLTQKINNSEKVIYPFPLTALIDDPKIQRKTIETFVIKRYPENKILSKIKFYKNHKKIRVGYFSSDFRDHPVSSLTAGLYEMHNRNEFEIHAFSYSSNIKDEMNLRIKEGVDYFHDVHIKSYQEVTNLSRSLEIDIAIDLGGFTSDSRTEIFAMRVAPIQLSYIGYLGTMGANYYDYLMADQTLIPEESKKFYSEKIAYLPCYQMNDSKLTLPGSIFTRKDLNLPEEVFVFCCFNNTFKITPDTFDSWARILKSVEGSVMMIYVENESAKINLIKEIEFRGVDSKRLIFGEHLPKSEYLSRYLNVDLFLDTFPYNAGTTASDALRMGLPVLTCIGNSFASRLGASIINGINLPELITNNQEQYETFAIDLANNPKKLKTLKDKLLKNLSIEPLFNTPLLTKNLESAFLKMYKRSKNGLEPDHIYIEQT